MGSLSYENLPKKIAKRQNTNLLSSKKKSGRKTSKPI